MLLHERDLGLHREHDVAQSRLGAAIRRDAGEDPRRPLLVHQPARAVDRIDEDPPPALVVARAARQHEPRRRQPFGDEHERHVARELARAPRRASPRSPDRPRRSCRPRRRPRRRSATRDAARRTPPRHCVRMRSCSARIAGSSRRASAPVMLCAVTPSPRGSASSDTARSSAAFSSGAVSLRKLPPPISGPPRYLSKPGLAQRRMDLDVEVVSRRTARRRSAPGAAPSRTGTTSATGCPSARASAAAPRRDPPALHQTGSARLACVSRGATYVSYG